MNTHGGGGVKGCEGISLEPGAPEGGAAGDTAVKRARPSPCLSFAPPECSQALAHPPLHPLNISEVGNPVPVLHTGDQGENSFPWGP